ncbi:MAG: transposon-encoded TnpW family protein [Oscillospiraceae bacterium]|nr:transposon-encoded TnpW family protein [Oscillospiraceae bacterium]
MINTLQTFSTERKIGATTYIIKSAFNPNAKENATSRVVYLVGSKIKKENK